MSRSYRNFPFYTGGTKRWGKTHSARTLRHKLKESLENIEINLTWSDQGGSYNESLTPRRAGCPVEVSIENDLVTPLADEIYDFWYDNDGGCYFNPVEDPKLLRK